MAERRYSWSLSTPTVSRYRLSLLPAVERHFLMGSMIRVPILAERWLTCEAVIGDAIRTRQLPAYMLAAKRVLLVSAADAIDFMDRVWPEYVTGVPDPDYTGRHWQRLSLADRCAFHLQLRTAVDVAMALSISIPRVNELIRAGCLRARIRPWRRRFGQRPGGSYGVVAADLIHLLDHSEVVLGASKGTEVESLRLS